MTNITDMNIVLGQGSAVKNMHNVGRHNLELNKQFAAQIIESRKQEKKKKIQETETDNRVEIDNKQKKKNKEESRQHKKDSKKNDEKKSTDSSEGSIIDIKV